MYSRFMKTDNKALCINIFEKLLWVKKSCIFAHIYELHASREDSAAGQ